MLNRRSYVQKQFPKSQLCIRAIRSFKPEWFQTTKAMSSPGYVPGLPGHSLKKCVVTPLNKSMALAPDCSIATWDDGAPSADMAKNTAVVGRRWVLGMDQQFESSAIGSKFKCIRLIKLQPVNCWINRINLICQTHPKWIEMVTNALLNHTNHAFCVVFQNRGKGWIATMAESVGPAPFSKQVQSPAKVLCRRPPTGPLKLRFGTGAVCLQISLSSCGLRKLVCT